MVAHNDYVRQYPDMSVNAGHTIKNDCANYCRAMRMETGTGTMGHTRLPRSQARARA
jgi:hypothetical protein